MGQHTAHRKQAAIVGWLSISFMLQSQCDLESMQSSSLITYNLARHLADSPTRRPSVSFRSDDPFQLFQPHSDLHLKFEDGQFKSAGGT